MYVVDTRASIFICVGLLFFLVAMLMVRYVWLNDIDLDRLQKSCILIPAFTLLMVPVVCFFEIKKNNPPTRVPTTRELIKEISNQQHATDSLMSARLVHMEELCDSLLLIATKNSETENLATSKD